MAEDDVELSIDKLGPIDLSELLCSLEVSGIFVTSNRTLYSYCLIFF